MGITYADDPTFENELAEMAYKGSKVLFAFSPLLILVYVFVNGFDDSEEEQKKREMKAKKCGGSCCD